MSESDTSGLLESNKVEQKTDNMRSSHGERTKAQGSIEIYPINGAFDYEIAAEQIEELSSIEWDNLISTSHIFEGYDDKLFGRFFVIVYGKHESEKICTISSTKFGVTVYKNLILNPSSRFWPSCKNLAPEYKSSIVRKALAITNLKNYNKIAHHPGSVEVTKYWDETDAGFLASNMMLIPQGQSKEGIYKLFELGLLQVHSMRSIVLDVVYDNAPDNTERNKIEDNNRIVFHLGEQLSHLFDPLLEYSPEKMDFTYEPPKYESEGGFGIHSEMIDSTVNELIDYQANIMSSLVNLLKNFIIPLRIYVLENGKGIIKLNQIFPPTIDEITRINCILHDCLVNAAEYSFIEVFKVMGSIIPYFYKAFIRHEANMKRFTARLNKFYSKNKELIFDNNQINSGNYTIRDVDAIVSGSLLELPRMKLILQRLKSAIDAEIDRKKNFENFSDNVSAIVKDMYDQSIQVIDAFGNSDINEVGLKKSNIRIFTPTGKILTEIASNWPSELHYGWLSRKLVGIYEVRNVLPSQKGLDRDVLIIFSDSLLFLTIMDEGYTLSTRADRKRIAISDILMHCLVNEKPIPESLPVMKVSCWCNINDVLVTSYVSPTHESQMNAQYLRFVNLTEAGFNTTQNSKPCFVKEVEMKEPNDSNIRNPHDIIELVNKAKILSKSQSFHLFRSNDSELRTYSSAHNLDQYKIENSKSTFALFLNINEFDPEVYFSTNPNLFLIVSAKTIKDNELKINTYNRIHVNAATRYIKLNELQSILGEIINENLQVIFLSQSPITETLIKSYQSALDNFSYFCLSDEDNSRRNGIVGATNETATPAGSKTVGKVGLEPKDACNGKPSKILKEHTNKEKSKRRSFFFKIFHPFKSRRNYDPQTENLNPSKIVHNIPQVTKLSPTLPSQEDETIKKDSIELNEKVGTRNICSDTHSSIIINQGFQFPMEGFDDKTQNSIIMANHARSESGSSHSSNVLHNGVRDRRSRGTRTAETSFAGSLSSTLVIQADNLKTTPDYFYNDGEANWISISRENSAASDLNANPKFETNYTEMHDSSDKSYYSIPVDDTSPLINTKEMSTEKNELDSNSKEDLSLNCLRDEEMNSKNNFDTFYSSTDKLSVTKTPIIWTWKRDMSVQSLTPSQIVDEFGKRIDEEFNLTENSRKDRVESVVKEETGLRYSYITSSDEEYFSMDEFTNSKLFKANKSRSSLIQLF